MSETLLKTYSDMWATCLQPVASRLEVYLKRILKGAARVDRICTRAKDPDRFVAKAEKVDKVGKLRYSDPLSEIQDQIGARVVVFYLQDVDPIAALLKDYLHPVEERRVLPERESEFGYCGKHFVCLIPEDVLHAEDKRQVPDFFELQIKTLFQHAWSEAEHDLGYKEEVPLVPLEKRKVAFTAAQAWGADTIFDELFSAVQARGGTK